MFAVIKDINRTIIWGVKISVSFIVCFSVILGEFLPLSSIVPHIEFRFPYISGLAGWKLIAYCLFWATFVYIGLLALTKSFVKLCELIEHLAK